MPERVVSKFGGRSNATAEAMLRCMELGEDSTVVVPSAPGKLSEQQADQHDVPTSVPKHFYTMKVTDQLVGNGQENAYKYYRLTGEIPQFIVDSIQARFYNIARDLGRQAMSIIDTIPHDIELAASRGKDSLSILGEDLTAYFYQLNGFEPLLPPTTGYSHLEPGHREAWRKQHADKIKDGRRYVLSSNHYYRRDHAVTYPRGGGDIAGANEAYGIYADLYENWTDNPAYSANPEIIRDKKRLLVVRHLTYPEVRALGLNGTGLFHHDAAVALMGTDIRTEIKNTFNPLEEPTVITNEPSAERVEGQVEAVSLITPISILTVHEPGMAGRDGRVKHYNDALSESHIVQIDEFGLDPDTHLFLVEAKDEDESLRLLNAAKESWTKITPRRHSLITVVGHNLAKSSAAIHSALDKTVLKEEEGEHFWPARNSIRFTVGPHEAEAYSAVHTVHEMLVENRD